MPSRLLRLSTRGSTLALAQSKQVAASLRERWPDLEVDLVVVATLGDQRRDLPLDQLAGPDGVFTHAVEAELLAGRADFAVHSLKDVPTLTDPRLVIAAIPPRVDPRDVFIGGAAPAFEALPQAARLGTSSPRRAAQALAVRADLTIVPVRGNVDTRLRKLRDGEIDGLLLAAAGLARLGRLDQTEQRLAIEHFTPAVGQGALAVQCRADDEATLGLLAAIDDGPSRAAVTAERAFLRALGGGCRVPLSAHAWLEDSQLRMRGFLAAPDGRDAGWDQLDGPADQPAALGEALAERMRRLPGARHLEVGTRE